METENALTIAKENSKENFFEEEARLSGQRCMASNLISLTLSLFNVCWRI